MMRYSVILTPFRGTVTTFSIFNNNAISGKEREGSGRRGEGSGRGGRWDEREGSDRRGEGSGRWREVEGEGREVEGEGGERREGSGIRGREVAGEGREVEGEGGGLRGKEVTGEGREAGDGGKWKERGGKWKGGGRRGKEVGGEGGKWEGGKWQEREGSGRRGREVGVTGRGSGRRLTFLPTSLRAAQWQSTRRHAPLTSTEFHECLPCSSTNFMPGLYSAPFAYPEIVLQCRPAYLSRARRSSLAGVTLWGGVTTGW